MLVKYVQSKSCSIPYVQALKKTRHSGLKPYIVFIASPRLERLQLTRKMGSEKLKRRLGSAIHHTDSDNAHIYTVSPLISGS